jgi:hypothetical protein
MKAQDEQNDRITLDEGIAWTTQWRSSHGTAAKAFLIPLKDLQGAMAEIMNQGGEPCARAYMGINDQGEEKLVIVGTKQVPKGASDTAEDVDYIDLLPKTADKVVTTEYGLWDFTHPCPPKCNYASPLNGAIG